MFRYFLNAFSLFVCLLACTACDKSKTVSRSPTVVRVSCENDPQTLDPRRARDLLTVTVMHMLYEGLMRNDADGQPAFAMAEAVTLSPDQRVYTFTLRNSAWSNGDPVTAYDFERTWKSALDPHFPSPNAYQLYVIRGAKAAKEGSVSIEQVGVHALDAHTLRVELEQSTPYFLQLVATHFYYPAHASLVAQGTHGNEAWQPVTNGPYQLEYWKRQNEFSAVPNRHYWDASAIRLDELVLVLLDNSTALQLFQKGELEWTGSPLSTLPSDALASLKREGTLQVLPAAGVYLLRVNTARPPFTHAKMRQAFALALNRQELVEHVLQGGQIPALGIVPPSFMPTPPLFRDHDVAQARSLFEEALHEQQLTVDTLPPVAIAYASGERAHKIAQVAQQQWKEVLGVQAQLHSMEAKVYYDRLKQHDYQLGVGSWFADFRDPIAFLEVFKLRNNGTNNTEWEDPVYIAQLDASSELVEEDQREKKLQEAETTLIREMPLIPLFYSAYNYVKKPTLKGVYFSELGYLDFKNGYFEE